MWLLKYWASMRHHDPIELDPDSVLMAEGLDGGHDVSVEDFDSGKGP